MPKTLKKRDWELLLKRIKDGKCTPFLGAGACHPKLPIGAEIAQEWVQKYAYPVKDERDLVRVAQFLAVKYDSMYPKEQLLERLFGNVPLLNVKDPDEPHCVLADLPLPVYLTTNYDDFIMQALKSRNKEPKRELCRWNLLIKNRPSIFDSGFQPTPANPVVFHLHGHNEVPESLVLTEDDYLDFLVNISRDQHMLPPKIQEALAGTSLLFIGYSLKDWDFRVIFRGIVISGEASLRRISVAVQLPPAEQEMQKYLDEYFGNIGMRVYWGTAEEFATELRERWEAFSHDN
jgi:hypothetical protein